MYDDLEFVNGGRFTSRQIWKHPRRRIDTNEIIIVTAGKIYIEVDGNEYTLSSGDVLCIKAGVLHGGTRNSDDTVSFYWIHFRGNEYMLPPVFSRPESIYQSELLARQILHYSNTEGYPPECADMLMRVLLAELNFSGDGDGSSSYKLYSEVREWVRANGDVALKVSDVAEHFKYNPDYLNRIFKRYFKDGLKAYIDTVRMQMIKHELTSGSVGLKEIAERYGFYEYKYFLKFFKYHEGVTPGEYRRTFFNIHTNSK